MKFQNLKIFPYFILLFYLLIFTFCISIQKVKAEGASLYFSPASGTFLVGSTFDVSVFVNTSGNNINAVKVNIKFDPKKIQVASPTAGKSFIEAWVAQPAYSNTQGTMSFIGGVPSPGINTSAGLVSTVTFRAISPGETSILFLESSIHLDDGKGTNILTSTGRGVYTLLIPPPEGPKVFSSTHTDQNKWYKNNNPTFSWEKEEGVTDFSYTLDQDASGVPDNVSERAQTSISFSNVKDEVWYFHVKAKKAEVWGGTSHYLVRIDSTPPASFTPEVSPSTKTSVSQPLISFLTTDALSGLEHFEFKYIDITAPARETETSFFIEVVSPYKLPTLKTGKYLAVVSAFDEAGNWRDESVKIEIVPGGIVFTKAGVWLGGRFFPWWIISLIILLLTILIIGFLIYRWKKHQKLQVEIKQRLKEREEKLTADSEKIKEKIKEY